MLEVRARHHDQVNDDIETVVLWRPTGPDELALVEASDWGNGHLVCPSSRSSTRSSPRSTPA